MQRIIFYVCCLWNAAAPLKAWFLSRYGFVPTTTTTIVNLHWDTVLNGKFLTQLYTNAGIPLATPLTATRYLNVFMDFKILPRSIGTWAGSYAGTETVYQMDLDGRPLRRSLDGAAEVAAFNAALSAFTASGFNLWGTELIRSYVPPTTSFGSLQDVAEAVLCLKGMSLETFSSGAATYEISGRDLFATVLGGSGYINSIFAPRETAWWCSIQYVDPATNAPNRTQCFERMSVALPAFFVGKYISLNSGSRYVDNADVVAGATIGNLQSYHYKHHEVQPLASIKLATLGNRTTWAAWIPEVIATVAQTPVDTSDAIEELCFVGDGCFAACLNETASGGTTYTYRRGGECVGTIDSVAISLHELYSDSACLGLGTGTSHIQVTYLNHAGVRSTRVASQAASPMAILACIVGGRVPNGDYLPSNFIDMVSRGTEASLVVTSSNGSEAIMLNCIALISLLGYVYFLLWIAIFAWRTLRWVAVLANTNENVAQLRFSTYRANLSTRVWMHERSTMSVTGFLGLVAWHLGASQCKCVWRNTASVADDPAYVCSINPVGHVLEISEVVRLLSHAWVFFALAFLDLFPGLTVHFAGYAVAVVLLALIPLLLWAIPLAYMMRVWASTPWLQWMHSHLFLALLWLTVLWLMRSRCFAPYRRLVERCLHCVGLRKQRIDAKSPLRSILGAYFWTDAVDVHDDDTAYVPLSLLLQTKDVAMDRICDHEYWLCQEDFDARDWSHTLPTTHPKWVLEHRGYYVRGIK
ncbi:hypothetical protein SPRG_21719 [Saprolegnia parasitica CBS 223.65]|uniref:Uncharacterized protein n=1 Tax=Saprolegnia parasitica (strain CBS 223.65) TaxID=695850 RepID=A0A067BNM1_SAPPC|nr:hypothetical protein SPRG_21719 [Saprolegnia parasitica CBS 223.65]KDO18345.1 hypothetical protein SPRG_21719 [Saprolegnia parasitica CBS 223.65]|eukprot:XP_012210949.1 hypothetical protein SPRG_21719 [Saprolegnia parasitica CBS 223.65]